MRQTAVASEPYRGPWIQGMQFLGGRLIVIPSNGTGSMEGRAPALRAEVRSDLAGLRRTFACESLKLGRDG